MKKALKAIATLLIISNLMSCKSNLPDTVLQAVSERYSSRGETYPVQSNESGVFYFNTEIIDSSKITVSNFMKDTFVDGYCLNLGFDVLYINSFRGTKEYLTERKISKFAYIAPSGKVTFGKGRKDWKNDDCTIEFISNENY